MPWPFSRLQRQAHCQFQSQASYLNVCCIDIFLGTNWSLVQIFLWHLSQHNESKTSCYSSEVLQLALVSCLGLGTKYSRWIPRYSPSGSVLSSYPFTLYQLHLWLFSSEKASFFPHLNLLTWSFPVRYQLTPLFDNYQNWEWYHHLSWPCIVLFFWIICLFRHCHLRHRDSLCRLQWGFRFSI